MLVKGLRELADNIDADNSNLTADSAADIFGLIFHIRINKEEACRLLNLRRSRFDDLVREGKIPKGKSEAGDTKLYWYKDEILKVAIKT